MGYTALTFPDWVDDGAGPCSDPGGGVMSDTIEKEQAEISIAREVITLIPVNLCMDLLNGEDRITPGWPRILDRIDQPLVQAGRI